MGISAIVYCNAESVLRGLNSSLFEVDPDTGEVSTAGHGTPDLPTDCTVAADIFLGNVDTIRALRDFVTENDPTLKTLLECVLCDGSHAGDLISVERLPRLEEEIARGNTLLLHDDDGTFGTFLADMKTLLDAAKRERNPIVFT